MNKKVLLTILSVVVVLAVIIVSIFIKKDSDNSTKKINMYFLNENGSSIEPEVRTLKYNNNNDILDIVIENILKGPNEDKNQPVVGKNTTVLDTTFNDTRLTINFSKEFLREDATKNMLSVYAIVRTICQIDRVSEVMITVEGQKVNAADDTPIGFLSNSDINLETDRYTTDSKEITLYFANKDGKLVKEKRTIKITDTRPIENYIINELIKGPVNKDLLPTLASDTELISAETAKSTCHVTFKNFIDKNLADPNSDKSKLSVYSVVNSLAELDSVTYVRFLFEGKTGENVGPFKFNEEFKMDTDLVE